MSAHEPIVLDNIPFTVDLPALLKSIHMDADSEDLPRVKELAAQAQAAARPKVVYRPAYVESRGDETVVIESHTFTSRVLRVNLDGVHRVFPYVCTSGMEIEQWGETIGDVLEQFWVDVLKRQALAAASAAFDRDIEGRFRLGKTARMNPGSLADWPMAEQRPLWQLLGNPTAQIGVVLKESFLMVPVKSVSGIRYPSEVTYENCQLCPRPDCPGRRAPYDEHLFGEKYSKR